MKVTMLRVTSAKSATISALFVLGLLCLAGKTWAESEQAAPDATAPSVAEDAANIDTRARTQVRVGMSLEEALKLVETNLQSQEEIGAACGMLDVFTYDDGMRIISVDGTVTSVHDGRPQ